MINFVDSFSQEIKFEFIAMQYYAGILNRSYIVQVSDSLILGGRVRGAIAAGISLRHSQAELEDPYFYANQDLLSIYHQDNLIHSEFLTKDNANFLIRRDDIQSVEYTEKKKWGMGDVIHSGRVFIKLKGGKKIELILLGRPDVESIIDKLGVKRES